MDCRRVQTILGAESRAWEFLAASRRAGLSRGVGRKVEKPFSFVDTRTGSTMADMFSIVMSI